MKGRTYFITPVAKPRMTRSDKWNKREVVMRYRAFCDTVRLLRVRLPERYHVTFVLPMPKSWPPSKKEQMSGQPHQSKPDKDNLEKALLDAIHEDDSQVWDGRVTKRWGYIGRIVVADIS